MKEKISIIIPVYNVEKYLEKCIESVLAQTYKNIEVICINDGSTDSSPLILDKYSKIDNRIKVFSRENKGLLFSRIDGIKKSTGDLITFLDSDDWFDDDYIEVLYNNMVINSADIVRCNLRIVKDENNIIKLKDDFVFELYNKEKIRNIVFKDICCSYKYNNAVRQLIRKKVFRNLDDIEYSIFMAEDLLFNLSFFDNINRLVTVNYYGYNYRQNSESITKTLNKNKVMKNLKDEEYVYKSLIFFIEKNKKEYLNISCARFFYQINNQLLNLARSENIKFNEYKEMVMAELDKKELIKIRESISIESLDFINVNHSYFCKLLFKNNVRLYCFLAFYFYRTIKNIYSSFLYKK